MSQLIRYVFTFTVSLVLLWWCPSCNDIVNPNETYDHRVNEHCDETNKCANGLVCASNICRAICHIDNDCPSKKDYCDSNNFCTPNPDGACRTGWDGVNCNICSTNYFGHNCSLCPDCGKHGICSDTLEGNGQCQCDPGWSGEYCEKNNNCPEGFTGDSCTECSDERFTGENCDECSERFTGENCDECSERFTGYNCSQCSERFTGENCDECRNPLKSLASSCRECEDPHFIGDDCTECAEGRFTGDSCTECSDERFTGENCDECSERFTGENCDECSNPLKSIASDCLKCNAPLKIGDKCDSCDDSRKIGENCDECLNPLKSIASDCLECRDPLRTGNDCKTCKYGAYDDGRCKNCQEGTTGTMTDDDNNQYGKICINGQYWMTENMKYMSSKVYAPDNNMTNSSTYGWLYDFETAKNVCPAGWHLPSMDEFNSLQVFLGSGAAAAAALRASSFSNGTNSSGFNALPAGYYSETGSFPFVSTKYEAFNKGAYFSTTPSKSENYGNPVYSCFGVTGNNVSQANMKASSACSVRCVQDMFCADNYSGQNCEKCLNPLKTLESECTKCENLYAGDNCDQCADPAYTIESDCTKCLDGVTDTMRDKNNVSYPTVCINGNFWMAKNMDYATGTLNKDYKYPNNNSNNRQTYGLLYTKTATKNICPEGWKLPSKSDFQNMLTFLGRDKSNASDKLRHQDFYDGNNESGFSALPAGYDNKQFGKTAYFWSSTADSSTESYYMSISASSTSSYGPPKITGVAGVNSCANTVSMSVRCLMDNEN